MRASMVVHCPSLSHCEMLRSRNMIVSLRLNDEISECVCKVTVSKERQARYWKRYRNSGWDTEQSFYYAHFRYHLEVTYR